MADDADKPGAPSLGIQASAFTRTILDTPRRAEAPLSARDIMEALARDRAGRPLDKQEFNLPIARLRNTIPRLGDKLDGELRERTTYWRIRHRD